MNRVRAWGVWLVCSLAGLVLIALPDGDRRLFSISEDHGPALADFVGAILLLAGWAVLDVQIWRNRRRLVTMPPPALIGLGLMAAVGAVLVGWSVLRDAGSWWVLGASALAGAQLVAAALPGSPRPTS